MTASTIATASPNISTPSGSIITKPLFYVGIIGLSVVIYGVYYFEFRNVNANIIASIGNYNGLGNNILVTANIDGHQSMNGYPATFGQEIPQGESVLWSNYPFKVNQIRNGNQIKFRAFYREKQVAESNAVTWNS